MDHPEPAPQRQSRPWSTDTAIGIAIGMTALGVSFTALVTTKIDNGLREIRQDLAAHNRAADARLDAANTP